MYRYKFITSIHSRNKRFLYFVDRGFVKKSLTTENRGAIFVFFFENLSVKLILFTQKHPTFLRINKQYL